MLIISIILGLLGGSFVTVVVTRGPIIWGLITPPSSGPEKMSLALPGSHCPKCQTPLRPRDLIPLLSYFLNQRRCRKCGQPISALYPAVEALGALSGLIIALSFTTPVSIFLGLVFLLSMLALGAIDVRTGYLPDRITLPLIVLGLGISFVPVFVDWRMALLGTAIGYGVFWLISTVYKQLRGQEGLGLGDAKLLAAIGAFTGPYALPFIILIAASGALAVALIAATKDNGIKANTEIRFGPYLALSGSLMLIVSERTGLFASLF